jgi:hypothetical protein
MTIALHLDPTGQSGRAMAAIPTRVAPTCAIRLVDRRTGQTHRINGTPLVLFTKTPNVAVAELLSGRDGSVWEARVEQIDSAPRKAGRR